MPSLVLYAVAILGWGSTWLMIKYQLGVVAPELSIAYRFLMASAMLFIWAKVSGRSFSFSKRIHGLLLLQGFLSFSLSYYLIYLSSAYLPSGINSIVFSIITVFNLLNAAWLLKAPITWKAFLGCVCGMIGVAMIYIPEVEIEHFDLPMIFGLSMSVVAALVCSYGNILAGYVHKQGVQTTQANAFAMAYGGLFSLVGAMVLSKPFVFDLSVKYVGSLLYLSIVGSMLTFGAFWTLIGRLGAERAGYPLLMVPVVSLLISQLFEDYTWTPVAFVGVLAILGGNFLVVIPVETMKKWREKAKHCLA